MEQFSSPMKASSMDAKSEFYAVEELTKTRTVCGTSFSPCCTHLVLSS